MIPTIYSGLFEIKGALPDVIEFKRSVTWDGHKDELTLVYPTTGLNAEYITTFSIVDAGKYYDWIHTGYSNLLYVIDKVSANGVLITAHGTLLALYMMRNTLVTATSSSAPYYGTDLYYTVQNFLKPPYNSSAKHYFRPSGYDKGDLPYTYVDLSKMVTLMDYVAGMEGSICDRAKKRFVTATAGNIEDGYYTDIVLHKPGDATYDFFDLAYGYNVKSYTYEKDISGIASNVTPYFTTTASGDENPTFITGGVASDSTITSDFYSHLCSAIDVTSFFETQPSGSRMKTYADRYMANHNAPSERITVELADDGKIGYGTGAGRVTICSIADISTPSGTFRVTVSGFEYDFIADRYTSINFGTPRKRFADAVADDIRSTVTRDRSS